VLLLSAGRKPEDITDWDVRVNEFSDIFAPLENNLEFTPDMFNCLFEDLKYSGYAEVNNGKLYVFPNLKRKLLINQMIPIIVDGVLQITILKHYTHLPLFTSNNAILWVDQNGVIDKSAAEFTVKKTVTLPVAVQ